ncbi:hypothetical protein Fcan01_25259 [Folsomia candida]|uniref:Uncharacterized protein n=1 Tax=Folsomia candida TaxID=158441 RepID=A0A226D439_FOLCA|nr:hypothetical protein Fcan01_25261 [Folsomia candida]OXA39999.1 hypothetical protein Fcan01_25257 [Folsomia candida]OXA40005.1 hypothetical protein Fcan01_25259 [Folsomia candida]
MRATKITSLSDLTNLWDSTNMKNLQAGVLLTSATLRNSYAVCGFSLSAFHEHHTFQDCMLRLLGEHYNFTYRPQKRNEIPLISLGKMDFGVVMGNDFVTDVFFYYLEMYDVKFPTFDFIIITQFPSPVNSIIGLFNPFEGVIGLSILASCIGITLILQSDGNGLSNTCNLLRSLQEFTMVQSLLFGQSIADGILKKVKNKKVSRPLLGIWFLSCYILMDNLYQGSIYSDLAVRNPPLVPKTFDELVSANVTIITTTPGHFLQKSGISTKASLLTESIIPDLLRKNFASNFNKFLKNLVSKIVYINAKPENTMSMSTSISKSITIRSNESLKSIPTNGMLAFMDTADYLQLWTELLNILGSRLVMQSMGRQLRVPLWQDDLGQSKFYLASN